MFVVESVLVICLVSIFPLLDKVIYDKLARGEIRKNLFLMIGITWSWILAGLIIYIMKSRGVGLEEIGLVKPDLDRYGETMSGLWVGACIGSVASPLFFWHMSRSEKGRTKLRNMIRSFKAILPSSSLDRWVFAALAVTAGVCEEVIYRSFLFHYFSEAPFHIDGILLVAVSGAIFGLAHLYQGKLGVLQTTVMGLALGAIFMATGSLMIPIIVHTFIDLKFCLIPESVVRSA
jgi:uncharacterized protein